MFIQEELSIKAMTISQVYSLFVSGRLVVNRKYQRKLCWSIEEKRNFMDTIINGLPVPMFLFAANDKGQYEIIDGMQRLDAICTFVEQKYSLKDGNFNLESMPDTIEEKRLGKLTQKKPVLDSKICKSISNYPLPVSIFPGTNNEDVEEVFKRINSTGKHLSFQELRQVGVSTQFATIVRVLASEIRGDISEDVLLLKNMSKISLSNYRLPYTIHIDDIFWVKNRIINEAEIRQSRDEEAIAYIIANMILPNDERKPLAYQWLNKLYGYSPNPLDSKIPIEMTQINNAIDRVGKDNVQKQFRIVMSCVDEMLTISKKSFRQIVNAPRTTSDLIVPFQVVFMAIHRLLLKEKRTKVNYPLFIKLLESNSKAIVLNVDRTNDSRENAINSLHGLIESAFSKGDHEDPAVDDWTLEFVNILNKSKTEQVLYDFKIGFVPYNQKKIDTAVIEQVLKTLTAINNVGPGKDGYLIIGVADKEEAAQKYAALYGFEYTMINDIPLCGVDHDATALSENIDRYTHTIKEYIKNAKSVPEKYRMHLLGQMKTPMLYQKHTIVLKTSYTEPVPYNDDFYIREFTDVHKLAPDQIATMFQNYYSK